MSARFRKMNLIESSNKPSDSGKSKKESVSANQYKITTEQKNQLSSIEAVVQAYRADALEDEECVSALELIQHDISHMTIYNPVVMQLIEAIDKDIKNIPKFDFANWVVNPNKPSATFDTCREMFTLDI